MYPEKSEPEDLAAAGPTPLLFEKAIKGLKRQRETDSHLEVQKFLKSVLG